MGQNSEPFSAMAAGTTTLSVTGTSGARVLAKSATPQTVVVSSVAGNAIAFLEFGDSTVAAIVPSGATGGGMPILPGAIYTLTVPVAATHFAAIGTSGTTLYVTCGHGA